MVQHHRCGAGRPSGQQRIIYQRRYLLRRPLQQCRQYQHSRLAGGLASPALYPDSIHCAAAHPCGQLVHLGQKEGLIQAMFHGKKMLPRGSTEEAVSEDRGLRALLLLIIAAALVATLVYLAPVPEYEFY